MTFEELEQKVIKWGEDRFLYEGSTDLDQMGKLAEELAELLAALLKYDEARIIDGIGDMVVVLIHIAHFNKLHITGCLWEAYNEIRDRKGKMIDGVFVKEE